MQRENFTLSSLYFGGGTPSLLRPEQIGAIIGQIYRYLRASQTPEITLEANPEGLSIGFLEQLLTLGVNRLSIGIQSFHDDDLTILGRRHNAEQAEQSLRQAVVAGVKNLSIDLIFAIPGQTLADWQENLQKALHFHPPHISLYGLTYEPGSPLSQALAAGQLSQCDEELEREMYLCSIETLTAAGYEQYEISNFALPGFRSRHNQKYWDGTPYIGFGPSAHSYFAPFRWHNYRDVEAYCHLLHSGELPIAEVEELSLAQQKAENIMLGLRRREGIDLQSWQKMYQEDLLKSASATLALLGGFEMNRSPFEPSPNNKLLTCLDNHLALTREGLFVYDYICKELYAAVS